MDAILSLIHTTRGATNVPRLRSFRTYHYMLHSTLYRKRNDAVVSRVKKAAGNRWEVMTENQGIGGARLRPDLVLKGKDVLIIDITLLFETVWRTYSRQERSKKISTRI